MARLLLGVSGGIAAYKALEFVRLATAAGHALRVIQTPASQRFVGPASFAALTGAPVLTDEFQDDPARGAFPGQAPPSHRPLHHLALVANADLYLIAPATANTLARLAAGLADNLLCTAALAADCPVVVAPAMNNLMYEHAATQQNIARLGERGVTVLEAGVGRLGSPGEWGAGRLAEPPELLSACEQLLAQAPGAVGAELAEPPTAGSAGGEGQPDLALRGWDGLSVLVTAGGTREPIDSVRYVGNRSSGRMGFALAEEAAARGARVTVLAANVSLPRQPGIRYVDTATAAELRAASVEAFSACDVLLMAAAVADFRPASAAEQKLKKADHQELSITLERTPDILAELARGRRDGQTLVGFAAEQGAGALDYGRQKLREKGLDAVVINDIAQPQIGFDSDENEVTIVTLERELAVARTSKARVAAAVLDAVAQLRAQASGAQA
ncbi:MAG TPA: bifunctional phosphopantothenoylcysteine decarboxylase/phosphopantothenate synthase [Solirubrobacteraceae bacterium]|jgi:phosphopantothenoylcysteine decarboxylase/phosphopantothenate--cysteine ligase|nr:bifunctional phosphopantothenoylcysteine decarboxylase/phosphopantothenate synthase [Solirubrobacteraceae bacterium]